MINRRLPEEKIVAYINILGFKKISRTDGHRLFKVSFNIKRI